jgi:hypothetical protein
MEQENQDAIDHLLLHEERVLTPWEVDFLESIDGNVSLSHKQQEKLDSIWNDVVVERNRKS